MLQGAYHMRTEACVTMTDLVRLLKALADPTRLRLVQLLSSRQELCVCELVDALAIAQYNVSRHLRVLKGAGLLIDWRQGKWMHYAMSPDLSAVERGLVAAVCARADQEAVSRQDRRRLKRSLRPRVGREVVACD